MCLCNDGIQPNHCATDHYTPNPYTYPPSILQVNCIDLAGFMDSWYLIMEYWTYFLFCAVTTLITPGHGQITTPTPIGKCSYPKVS